VSGLDLVFTEEFLAAIGRLTLSWGDIEAGIDFAVLAIYRDLGGETVERVIPRSLDRKLEFLKAAGKQLPLLVPFRDRLIELKALVKKEADFRQDVIHSVSLATLKKGNAVAALRFLRDNTDWTFKPVYLETLSVLKAANRANDVACQTLTLGNEIAGLARTHRTMRDASDE
jgi:hypothetical protein